MLEGGVRSDSVLRDQRCWEAVSGPWGSQGWTHCAELPPPPQPGNTGSAGSTQGKGCVFLAPHLMVYQFRIIYLFSGKTKFLSPTLPSYFLPHLLVLVAPTK